jgi:citronellol/citronellal dehydrogenase
MAEHIRSLPAKVPAGRLGTESEISAAIVFLLSPAAGFISGSCIRIDGAVPNNKRVWDHPRKGATQPFDGFHLATKPKVLE